MNLHSLSSGTVIPRLREIELSELNDTTRRRLNKALWDLEFREQTLERPLSEMAVRLTLEYVEWLITIAKVEELQFTERLALEFLLYEFEEYMWMMRSKRGMGTRLTRSTVLSAWTAEKELFRELGRIELGSRWDSQVASIQLALLDVKGWRDETVRIFTIVMRKMLCLKGCHLVTDDESAETSGGGFDIHEPLHMADSDLDILDIKGRPSTEEGVLNQSGDVDFDVSMDEKLEKSDQVESTPPVDASIPIPSSMSPISSAKKLDTTDTESTGVSNDLNNKGVMQKLFSMAPKFPNLMFRDQKPSDSKNSTTKNERPKSEMKSPEKRALKDEIQKKRTTELNMKGPPSGKNNALLENQNVSDQFIPQKSNPTVQGTTFTEEVHIDNDKSGKESSKSSKNDQSVTSLNSAYLHKDKTTGKGKGPIDQNVKQTSAPGQGVDEAILEVQQTQSPAKAPQSSHELSGVPPNINISSSQSPTISEIHQLTQSSQGQVSTITNDIQSGQRDTQIHQGIPDISSDFTDSSAQQKFSQSLENYKLLKQELCEVKTSLNHVNADFSVIRERTSELDDLIGKHTGNIEQLSKNERRNGRDICTLLDIFDLRFKTIVNDIDRLRRVTLLWGTLDNDLANFRAEVSSKYSRLDTSMVDNSIHLKAVSNQLETLESSVSRVLLDFPKIIGTLDDVVSKMGAFQSFKSSLESCGDLNERLSQVETSMKALSFNMDSLSLQTKNLKEVNEMVQSLNTKVADISQSFSSLYDLKNEVQENKCELTKMGETIDTLSSLHKDTQSNSDDAGTGGRSLENRITTIENFRHSTVPDLQRRLGVLEQKVGPLSEMNTRVSNLEDLSFSFMNRDEINEKLAAISENIAADITPHVRVDVQSLLNKNGELRNSPTNSTDLLKSSSNNTDKLSDPSLHESSNSSVTAVVSHETSSAVNPEGERNTAIQKSSKGVSKNHGANEELSALNSGLTRTVDEHSTKIHQSISDIQANVIKLGTAFLDLTKDQKDKLSVINSYLEKNDRSIDNLRKDVESYTSGNYLHELADRIAKLEKIVVKQLLSGNKLLQDENQQLKETISCLETKFDQQEKKFEKRMSLHVRNTNDIIDTLKSEMKTLQQRVLSSENDFTLSPPLGTSTQSQSTQKPGLSIIHSRQGIGEDTQTSPEYADIPNTKYSPGNFPKSRLVVTSQNNESKKAMSSISLAASLLNKVKSDPKSGFSNREQGSKRAAANEALDLGSVDIKKLKLIRKPIDTDD